MKLPVLMILLLGTVSLAAADRSYAGDTRRPDAKNWRYTLTLFEKGRAVLRTVKSAQSNVMEQAVWKQTEAGEISLQFLNRAGQPRGQPLVWRQDGGQLTALTWDKADWGEAGPPSLRGG
jgi:hypothetical protein